MNEKGFESEIALDETPNFNVADERPLNSKVIQQNKVDINVLKARVQKIQDKEQKKNIFIFSIVVAILGLIGIYFSI
jgi:hypothetical protein